MSGANETPSNPRQPEPPQNSEYQDLQHVGIALARRSARILELSWTRVETGEVDTWVAHEAAVKILEV